MSEKDRRDRFYQSMWNAVDCGLGTVRLPSEDREYWEFVGADFRQFLREYYKMHPSQERIQANRALVISVIVFAVSICALLGGLLLQAR